MKSRLIHKIQQIVLTSIFVFILSESSAFTFKLNHSIEAGLMQAFIPTDKFILYEINPYVDFWYNRYKRYSYPSLRIRYAVTHSFKKNLEAGIEIGSTFRYQQRINADNYNTFYSFPIGAKISYDFLKLNQHKSLNATLHAGYTYKHPKQKYWDGTGGYLVSGELGYRNKRNKTSLSIGYEIEQSKEYFLYKPEFFSQIGEERTYSFNRLVHGIYMSIKLDIR